MAQCQRQLKKILKESQVQVGKGLSLRLLLRRPNKTADMSEIPQRISEMNIKKKTTLDFFLTAP